MSLEVAGKLLSRHPKTTLRWRGVTAGGVLAAGLPGRSPVWTGDAGNADRE